MRSSECSVLVSLGSRQAFEAKLLAEYAIKRAYAGRNSPSRFGASTVHFAMWPSLDLKGTSAPARA